jgi:hypothetical protein
MLRYIHDFVIAFQSSCCTVFLDRLTFPKQQEPTTGKRKAVEEEPSPPKKIIVHPHVIENRGPYPYNQPKK